jgi:hypothetical protein
LGLRFAPRTVRSSRVRTAPRQRPLRQLEVEGLLIEIAPATQEPGDAYDRSASDAPHHDEFHAYLDGRWLCRSSTPFISAARVLMREGQDPETILTMRHRGSMTVALRGKLGRVAGTKVKGSYFYPDPDWEDD